MSKKLVEEIIWEQLAPVLEGLAPINAATLQEQEKVGVFSDETQGEEGAKANKGFLDVEAIVRKLTSKSSTKEKVNERFSFEEAISIIKKNLYRGKKLSDDSSVEDIHRHFVGFLQPPPPPKRPSAEVDEPCTDIQTLVNRALVNSAYYQMFTEHAQDIAGSLNEVFLSNLIGGTPIKQGTTLDGTFGGVSNIADFNLGELYFSLKTKGRSQQFEGSIGDMLATLGIPFLELKNKKEKNKDITVLSSFSTRTDPIGRFFIIVFGKPVKTKMEDDPRIFGFSTIEVKQSDIIDHLQAIDQEGGEIKINLDDGIGEEERKLSYYLVDYFTDRIAGQGIKNENPARIEMMMPHIPGFQNVKKREEFLKIRGDLKGEGDFQKLGNLILKNIKALMKIDVFKPENMKKPNTKVSILAKGSGNVEDDHGTKTLDNRNEYYETAFYKYKTLMSLKEKGVEEVYNLGKLKKSFTFLKGKISAIEKGAWAFSTSGRTDKRLVSNDQIETQDIDFQDNQEMLKQQAEKLGSQLTYTLNLINEYFMSIEKLMLEYASRPSQANLEAFQAKANDIGKESITTIDGLFRCKDENPLDKPS